MTPGHDLDGARSVVALDVAPVRNPRLLERYVPAEAVAVDDCVLQNDGVEEKGRQVALVRQRPRAWSAAPSRRCGNAAPRTGSLTVHAPRTGKPLGQASVRASAIGIVIRELLLKSEQRPGKRRHSPFLLRSCWKNRFAHLRQVRSHGGASPIRRGAVAS